MLPRLFLSSLLIALVAGACAQGDDATSEETTSTVSTVTTVSVAPTTAAAHTTTSVSGSSTQEAAPTTTSTTVATTTDHGVDSSLDIATVEQLIDAHDQAWMDKDPEGVGALYTDEGVFVDLTAGKTVGREAIVKYAEGHVAVIAESRRTGPVQAQQDGTFAYPSRLVVIGFRAGTYAGVAVVAIEDGLFTRYDVSQLRSES